MTVNKVLKGTCAFEELIILFKHFISKSIHHLLATVAVALNRKSCSTMHNVEGFKLFSTAYKIILKRVFT